MRLRRESGDYSIVTTKLPKTIQKGLSGEDFIGAIVHNPTTKKYTVISEVTEDTDKVTLGTLVEYIPSTGELKAKYSS